MTLTDEILENISNYNMASFDAEANVIKAHMEACMRDIQIASECENAGIIMESDIIPERNGENIFKYILFFLPRLVINLMRKLREWITGEHIETEAEAAARAEKEVQAALESGDLHLLDVAREKVASKINKKVLAKFPNATMRVTIIKGSKDSPGAYDYTSRMNIPKIEETFSIYRRYYEQYTQVFAKLDSETDISVDESITSFEKDLSYVVNIGISNVFLPYDTAFSREELKGLIERLRKGGDIFIMTKEIEELMNALIKKYHEMDKNTKISNSNMRFATQYMGSIKIAHARFTDFSTRIYDEIMAMESMMKLIAPTSKEIFDELKNLKENDRDMGKILKERGFYNGD
jgi:hypothetical protein